MIDTLDPTKSSRSVSVESGPVLQITTVLWSLPGVSCLWQDQRQTLAETSRHFATPPLVSPRNEPEAVSGNVNRVFSHDVTAAILVSQNNETAAMLESQTSPVGVELFSYANALFCSNKFAWFLATWVKTLYRELKQLRRRPQRQLQKNNRFNNQNNSSARTSRFLVHFCDVHCTTTSWNLPSTVLQRTWTYDDEFSFLFSNLNKVLKNSNPGKVACFWHIERVQIDAIKFERAQIRSFF